MFPPTSPLTLLALLLALYPSACRAYPSFEFNIPNGGRVACPPATGGFDVSTCEQHAGEEGAWCTGVGHATCTGGSLPLNPFGVALKAHGYEWTKALCEADTDGDGLTNGQELGDPCCTWTRGDAPSPYQEAWGKKGASHPGFADEYSSYTPPSCDAAGVRSPNVATARAQFNDGEERRNITWRIRDFKLPRQRTTYINVVFNIDEPANLETHEEYHIVYGNAIVDQPDHLHHFVVSGCTQKINASLEGKALEDTPNGVDFLDNCEEPVGGFWAPGGRPMWDVGTNQGVRIGTAANVVAISVNIHYTDGDTVANSTEVFPKDGITMYYTPDLRPKTHVFTKLINIVGLGNVPIPNAKILKVPAGKKRWYLPRRCPVADRCKDASMKELSSLTNGRLKSCPLFCRLGSNAEQLCPETCSSPEKCTGGDKPLRVTDSFFHAHLLGTEMYQSVFKHDTGAHIDLGSMRHWTYADETAVPLDSKGLDLHAGDVLLSTCVYNTQHMSEATKFGRSTYDEMCLNMLGVELDTADKHHGSAFSCEGAVWSGELGDHESALNIHASETLLATSSDCWSKIGNGLDCTEANTALPKKTKEDEGIEGPSPKNDDEKGEKDDDDDDDDDVQNGARRYRTAVAAAVAVAMSTTFHFLA